MDDNSYDDPLQDSTQDDPDRFVNGDDDIERPEREPHLPEDGATPAAPATDVPGARIPLDHPQLDAASNIDIQEAYDEGLGNASGVNRFHEEGNLAEDIAADDEENKGRIR
jgi:hypothetical protein